MTTHPENDNVSNDSSNYTAEDLKHLLLRTGPNDYWYHTRCSWGYHMKGTQTCEVCDKRGGTNWICFDANGKHNLERVIACHDHTLEVLELMLKRCEAAR
jgi:hypothetical protein